MHAIPNNKCPERGARQLIKHTRRWRRCNDMTYAFHPFTTCCQIAKSDRIYVPGALCADARWYPYLRAQLGHSLASFGATRRALPRRAFQRLSRLQSRCSFGPHNAIPRATHQP